MRLKVIGTGSSGNAYYLEAKGDALLIEAGLRWNEILPALPNGLRDIRGCLITHEHKDHCKCVDQVIGHGIKTVMSPGTCDAIYGPRIPLSGIKLVSAGDVIRFGPYTVMAVRALHDAAEPLAFLIRHDYTEETVLYATDTYQLPNRYPGINYWLVECNYTMAKAEELLETPDRAMLYQRLMRSHMSMERLVDALKENDLRVTRTIVLLHISDERGDSPLMEETIHKTTGIRTIAAYNGLDIKLGTCPF